MEASQTVPCVRLVLILRTVSVTLCLLVRRAVLIFLDQLRDVTDLKRYIAEPKLRTTQCKLQCAGAFFIKRRFRALTCGEQDLYTVLTNTAV